MQLSCLFVFWVHLFFLLNFTFPSLSLPLLPPKNITLYDNAFFRDNGISLTQETSCLPSSSPSAIGRALYIYPIRFLDLKSKETTSFTCRFSFSIISNPLCPFGDGIVFLTTSNANSFSFSNGYMGLPQLDLNSQDSYFAVEFDTNLDPLVGDINGNHIGVDVNTVVSLASVDVVSKGVDLKSGKKITAWIEYRDSANLIQIWDSYSSTKPPSPVLVAQIDLSMQFKEYMHVGFSASNGQGSAMHIVDHWRFKTLSTYRPSESNGCNWRRVLLHVLSRGSALWSSKKKSQDGEHGCCIGMLSYICCLCNSNSSHLFLCGDEEEGPWQKKQKSKN
ncbi:hypothetical protein CRYUN_Cryun35bG0077900 [Craigia yunnanensis]